MPRVFVCVLCLWLATVVAADEDTLSKTLSIWDCDRADGTRGLERETARVKQGEAAARWRNHPQVTGFSVSNVPQDWTGYNQLRLWVHNAKPAPTRIMIIVRSENASTDGMDYWSYGIRLGFIGWKELVLPIGGKGGTRSPRGWDQVDELTFTASGWSNTPHAEADVVIDDVRLQYDPPRPGPRMTDKEFFRNLDLSRTDLTPIRTAVEAGDLEAAKAALLDHMRIREKPRWWFDWRDRPTVQAPVTGGSDGWDYYVTAIKIDWTGWKQITLPLGEWRTARRPIGWHWISDLRFSAIYGDRTPSPDTVLVLDAIELTGRQPVSLGDFESAEDFRRWRFLQPTTDPVKQGSQAAIWSRLPERSGLRITDVPRDWREFEALRFWAHSSKATGDVITITADSDIPDIVLSADRILEHTYGGYFLGDDIDWESNKHDPDDPAFTREWTYGLNRFSHWRTLGQAYRTTGDEKYAKEWIAQMRDWVEDNPWPVMGTGNSTLTWRTIEAGIRTSGTWPDALYYFLGSPSLGPDDLVTFLKSWIEHAHHLMRITVEYPEHGGNWVTMECNGLGHLGILLPECRDAQLWLKTAVDRLSLELDRQVYPDGAQKELTTSYHQVALRNFVGLLRIAEHSDVPVPKDYLARLERMYEYNLKAMTPEGRLPPLNDAGYTGVLQSLEEGAEFFGREDFRWAATGGVQGAAPDYTSVEFPYAGQSVMRSGWDRVDRYLLFESGPFGIGHQQHRSGLRDTYETDTPLENLWIHNNAFDAADGVYESGYGPNRDIQVDHARTVVFVRPDYWVVVDRLQTEGQHHYDILWHLNSDGASQDAQTLSSWGTDEGVSNLMVTPASTEGLDLEIVVGRDEPVLGFAPASGKNPIPVLNYNLKATGPATMAWVLTPYPAKRPSVKAEMLNSTSGTIVTVSHAEGTDMIYVAPRGQSHRVTLGPQELKGRIAVVRRNCENEIVTPTAE